MSKDKNPVDKSALIDLLKSLKDGGMWNVTVKIKETSSADKGKFGRGFRGRVESLDANEVVIDGTFAGNIGADHIKFEDISRVNQTFEKILWDYKD